MVATNGASYHLSLEGTVGRVNEKGFTLAGREGWLNVSKFAAVALPDEGAHVLVGLDKSGYVREVETLRSTRDVSPDDLGETHNAAPVDKDRRITRMAAINSAIALLNNTGPASVEQVLATAEAFEQWVTR